MRCTWVLVIAMGCASGPSFRDRVTAGLSRPTPAFDKDIVADARRDPDKAAIVLDVCKERMDKDLRLDHEGSPCWPFISAELRRLGGLTATAEQEEKAEREQAAREHEDPAAVERRAIAELATRPLPKDIYSIVTELEEWRGVNSSLSFTPGPTPAEATELKRRADILLKRHVQAVEKLALSDCKDDQLAKLADVLKNSQSFQHYEVMWASDAATKGVRDARDARCKGEHEAKVRAIAESKDDAVTVVERAIAEGVPMAAAGRKYEAIDKLIASDQLEYAIDLTARYIGALAADHQDPAPGQDMVLQMKVRLSARYEPLVADARKNEMRHPATYALLRRATQEFAMDALPPLGPAAKKWDEYQGRSGVLAFDNCWTAKDAHQGLVVKGLHCELVASPEETTRGTPLTVTTHETYRGSETETRVTATHTVETRVTTAASSGMAMSGNTLVLDLVDGTVTMPVPNDRRGELDFYRDLKQRVEERLTSELQAKSARLLAAGNAAKDPDERAELYARAYFLNPKPLEEVRAFFVKRYHLPEKSRLGVD